MTQIASMTQIAKFFSIKNVTHIGEWDRPPPGALDNGAGRREDARIMARPVVVGEDDARITQAPS